VNRLWKSVSTDSKEGVIFSIMSVNVEVAALSKREHIRNLEMNWDVKDNNPHLQITETQLTVCDGLCHRSSFSISSQSGFEPYSLARGWNQPLNIQSKWV